MKKNLLNFGIAFVLASLTLYLLWVIFVNPCSVSTPVVEDQRSCVCWGKKIDFNAWLGKFEPDRQVHYQSCVGIVRKVIK
jgi:hypothetical protein